MISIQFIIWVTVIIGLVIFVHEFGHFLAAKLLGVRVEEFAFGFGKKVIGKKIGGTLYRINIIPYGGYVRLLGQEKESKDPKSYSIKPFFTKVIILVAGVTMNFFLAVLTFYVFLYCKGFGVYLPVITDYNFFGGVTEIHYKPFVGDIIDNTPAAEVNFPKEVIIWGIDDVEITKPDDLIDYLESHKGEEIEIEVVTLRGERRNIKVVPRETEKEGVLLGIEFAEGVAVFYKVDYSANKVFSGILHSLNFTGYNLDVFRELIVISFREKSVKPVSEGVSGIVGVANTVLDIVKVGDIPEILNLLAGINLSLALVNLLPIPGLDGGYLLFLLIEKIRGKKLDEKYEEWALRIGFAFLIILAVLITVKDIIQFKIVTRFLNLIKSLF